MTPVDVFVSVLEESIRRYKLLPNARWEGQNLFAVIFFLQFYDILVWLIFGNDGVLEMMKLKNC